MRQNDIWFLTKNYFLLNFCSYALIFYFADLLNDGSESAERKAALVLSGDDGASQFDDDPAGLFQLAALSEAVVAPPPLGGMGQWPPDFEMTREVIWITLRKQTHSTRINLIVLFSRFLTRSQSTWPYITIKNC